jgi:predicted acyl esterase
MKLPASAMHESERDHMHIDWNVTITMDDSLLLRADVSRPIDHTGDARCPVILHLPYRQSHGGS